MMEPVILDVSTWTRLAEVRQYAEYHETTLEDAIRALVNTGLSYDREWSE